MPAPGSECGADDGNSLGATAQYTKKRHRKDDQDPSDAESTPPPTKHGRYQLRSKPKQEPTTIAETVLKLVTGDPKQATQKGKSELRKVLKDIEKDFKQTHNALVKSDDRVRQLQTELREIKKQDKLQVIQELAKIQESNKYLILQAQLGGVQRELEWTKEDLANAKERLKAYDDPIEAQRVAMVRVQIRHFMQLHEPSENGGFEYGLVSFFFHGRPHQWSEDIPLGRIEDPDLVEDRMRKAGVINSSQEYLNAPQHLKFDMDLPNGDSARILLRAALTKFLCDNFLSKPFFLDHDYYEPLTREKQQGRSLSDLLREFLPNERMEAIEWRIQTLERLIKISPPTKEYSTRHAKAFLNEYSYLVKSVTEDSEEDLAKLILDFINVTIVLWTKRTIFNVVGFPEMPSQTFDMKNDLVHDASGVCLAGQHHEIHGRPLAVLVQPIVMATRYKPSGEEMTTVCWSRACVWVSQKNE
ncbi:hypothetical protein PT974_05140 [Cladobotryum mycophilum]|uniref:Uncharacterized protein n=1 Tax=Cladobotryum mycophilum TaxID=491253 RepID=A0ABR0SSE4_9HYPO